MAVDRPTFNENWYRVATLKPALRSVVQTYRQHYRGRMWHVLRDPSNNQFFRLDDAGYHFVGMLNGQRTVAQVWEACNEELGDRAPTQGEAIQLLGQLFTSNLLQCELPADAASMFERYRKRIRREVGGYLMNLLFLRVPLFDPERILERWVGVFGWLFGKVGFVLWALLLGYAATRLTGHWDDLIAGADPQLMLQPENLLLLYLGFGIIKAIHEFGHGFACKRYGRINNSGGEVHTIGIMFLVFMPVPYVDASSSWAFRNKWQRAFVGAAGMYIELAVAAVAAIIWSVTAPGLVKTLCYNMMFIASVSTIFFNGNPLLRFDGYYILSDLLEIPNLSQRSKEYIYYLVKKYIYRARRPRNPGHSAGEKFWLFIYAVTSSIYRVFISIAILFYVMTGLPKPILFIGFIFALSGIIGWIIVPLFKWFKYLATSGEIARTRPWAMASTTAFMAAVIGFIGVFPFPDHMLVEGVLEPRNVHIVRMGANGRLVTIMDTDTRVRPGDALVRAENEEYEAQLAMARADRREAQTQTQLARADNQLGLVQAQLERIRSIDERIAHIQRDLEALTVRAPIDGQWVAPDMEKAQGTFLARGDELGIVATTDDLFIRGFADQKIGPLIEPEVIDEAARRGQEPIVRVRIKGRPEDEFDALITEVLPAGSEKLPSAALGYVVGGSVQVGR